MKHGKQVFEYYQDDPRRGARFASAMAGYGTCTYDTFPRYPPLSRLTTDTVENQFDDLKDSYAWGELKDRRLIDIGGGRGHVTIALARVSHIC
jgi:hypothetical protein